MMWSPQDILMGLYIAVAVMLIIALYHAIFILVDVRKITRRTESLTREVETVILKPLSMTDRALEWVEAFFQQKSKQQKAKHKE
jgi:cell shape-determining protein MreC